MNKDASRGEEQDDDYSAASPALRRGVPPLFASVQWQVSFIESRLVQLATGRGTGDDHTRSTGTAEGASETLSRVHFAHQLFETQPTRQWGPRVENSPATARIMA